MVLLSPALALCVLAHPFPQVDHPATLRRDRAYTVDPNGLGDFVDLSSAVAAVPRQSLLLLKPGVHQGATIDGKGVRIESEVAGGAVLDSPLVVENIPVAQSVHVSGLRFNEGFTVSDCSGPVSFAHCAAVTDDVFAAYPPGLMFWEAPFCGSGTSRHIVENSSAVNLTDCSLAGRNGYQGNCDGLPGEHALMAVDSSIAVYGGAYVGGHGGDGFWCHGTYPGSGGDGIHATGLGTRVLVRNVTQLGGTGGRDNGGSNNHGCEGEPTRTTDGAVLAQSPANSIGLDIVPLARPGVLANYTITAPAGADIFLVVAQKRSWREFLAGEGILHLATPFQAFPLGTMGPAGTLTRPFPTPSPAWAAAFAGIELQAYARIGNLERYSEPRTLHVTAMQ